MKLFSFDRGTASMHWLSCTFVILALTSCSPEISKIGSSILSSTGVMSSSQADALFAAGGKLAKATSPLSEEEEYYLGRGVSASILSTYRPLRDPQVTRYINRVGLVVAARSGKPETFGGYHFLVLDTDEVNALSAPGGFIFISKGLLRRMKDEDALAAVLAHEVGHVALGHGVKAISEANMTEALTLIGREAASAQAGVELQQLAEVFGESVGQVVNTLLVKGYSRSQEYEADVYAAELLRASGYVPHALIDMLQAVEHGASQSSEAGWYATHPSAADRIDEIEDNITISDAANAAREVRAKRFAATVKRLA